MFAIKAARAFTGRPGIAKIEGAFTAPTTGPRQGREVRPQHGIAGGAGV